MRYRSGWISAAAILAWAGCLPAQTTPGAIQGKVLSADGKPIPRATIYYGRGGHSKAKAAASVLPPILSAKAGLDGSFTLQNLSPGGWIVCAEASGYLDPCHWSAAPAFTVAAGQIAGRKACPPASSAATPFSNGRIAALRSRITPSNLHSTSRFADRIRIFLLRIKR